MTQVLDQAKATAVQQVQLHDGDIRRGAGEAGPRLSDRAGEPDDDHIRLPLECDGHGLAEDGLVVDEEHPRRIVAHRCPFQRLTCLSSLPQVRIVVMPCAVMPLGLGDPCLRLSLTACGTQVTPSLLKRVNLSGGSGQRG
jgi:hypothetical protein